MQQISILEAHLADFKNDRRRCFLASFFIFLIIIILNSVAAESCNVPRRAKSIWQSNVKVMCWVSKTPSFMSVKAIRCILTANLTSDRSVYLSVCHVNSTIAWTPMNYSFIMWWLRIVFSTMPSETLQTLMCFPWCKSFVSVPRMCLHILWQEVSFLTKVIPTKSEHAPQQWLFRVQSCTIVMGHSIFGEKMKSFTAKSAFVRETTASR